MAENAAAAAAAPAPAPTRPAVLDDLVTDLARIVFASTLDRHNYNFAIRSLMMSSAFDQSIAEQFMFYGDSSVLKMRTAAQKFLDRISQVELQDVAEINALQIVYEVVEKIKTRMQTMVMPCEVEVIFDVLYAAVALMDDKTRTPFVAKFVHDVENVTEYITAGESVERFINDVQQEREHILAARGWMPPTYERSSMSVSYTPRVNYNLLLSPFAQQNLNGANAEFLYAYNSGENRINRIIKPSFLISEGLQAHLLLIADDDDEFESYAM